MLIAQITDTHVSTPESKSDTLYQTAEHLDAAVEHLNALTPRPDVVVITGDLVDRGEALEYGRLRERLEPLRMPAFLLPGNHDDRQVLPRTLDRHRYLPTGGAFLQYTVEDWPVRLVALDTLIPGEHGGELCAERLAWLSARLDEAPNRPTIVLMHHPPFVTGIRKMDQMGLAGADGLADVIRRHPQVERVLCGHVHRAMTRRFAGTIACTAPATAHQIALDLGPVPRLASVMEPPSCLLHLWNDAQQSLVTHQSFIGDRHVPFMLFDGKDWQRDAAPPAGFNP